MCYTISDSKNSTGGGNVVYTKALKSAIENEKEYRLGFVVCNKDNNTYELQNTAYGKKLRLVLHFYHLDKLPDCQDVLYFSENIFEGMRENLYVYQFSAKIGEVYARKPHNFLIDPEEFLILQYADGKTILLEEQYG